MEWRFSHPLRACESVDPPALRWLLEHGADPNCPRPERRVTALDYLIGTYARSAQLATCIDLLIGAGGVSRYNLPGVLDTIQNRVDRLAEALDVNPGIVQQRFPELDCGSTGARASCCKARRSCMWPRNSAVLKRPGFSSIEVRRSTVVQCRMRPVSVGRQPSFMP